MTAEERRSDGSIALTILGVEVVVPAGVPTRGSELAKRLDEKRPDKQETLSIFGRPLTIGGELQVLTEYRRNFDLDDATRKDKVELDDHIELEGLYFLTPRVLLFAQGKFTYAPAIRLDTGARDTPEAKEVERREHWLFAGDVLQNVLGRGYSLQIGRQKFQEVREWWWDRDLDALRVYYDGAYKLISTSRGERLLFDLGQDPGEAENLARREPERVADMERRLDTVMSHMDLPTGGGTKIAASSEPR